jgi:hypothetical protein
MLEDMQSRQASKLDFDLYLSDSVAPDKIVYDFIDNRVRFLYKSTQTPEW